jgi:hypothetical protein
MYLNLVLSPMKTPKEIQLAAITFLRAFKNKEAKQLKGTFIAFNPIELYKRHQQYLKGAVVSGLLFIYLLYNAAIVDSVYYWHVDIPVVLGLIVVFFFFIISSVLTKKYLEMDKAIKALLVNSGQSPYGILITDEYYFENTPSAYHIIARKNIIRIDYEEKKADGQIYLEVVLELEDRFEVRGLIYKKEEFDLKTWVEEGMTPL